MKNIVTIFVSMLFTLNNVIAQRQEVLTAKFEDILQQAVTNEIFSGNVLVMQNGKKVYKQSTGKADIALRIPNTGSTMFSIGSITKLFTKVIMLQLIAEQKINKNDNLNKYINGFSDIKASGITITLLLDHQSGLGQYADYAGWDQVNATVQSIDDIMNVIKQQPLLFQPGVKTKYSNSGYVVLGAVIEKVTGKKYEQVLKERIFKKLGMTNSGYTVYNKPMPGKAIGYFNTNANEKKDNISLHLVGASDGGIYSTSTDMWKFAQSLMYDNKILGNTYKLALVNNPLFPEKYNSWNDFKMKGRMVIAGGDPGVSAVLSINMGKNYCGIFLSNYNEGSAGEVAKRFSQVLNNMEPEPYVQNQSMDNDDRPGPREIKMIQMLYDYIKKDSSNHFHTYYRKQYATEGMDADNDMILLYVGERLLKEKDFNNAIELYKVYTTDFPNIVVAWNDLGDAYLAKGNRNEAINCYKKSLQIRPGNERAAEALKKSGQ